MAKLTSRSRRVFEKLEQDGKVTTLSFQQSSSIDHNLATKLRKIKTEFEVKEKQSRAYVAQIELSSINN